MKKKRLSQPTIDFLVRLGMKVEDAENCTLNDARNFVNSKPINLNSIDENARGAIGKSSLYD